MLFSIFLFKTKKTSKKFAQFIEKYYFCKRYIIISLNYIEILSFDRETYRTGRY